MTIYQYTQPGFGPCWWGLDYADCIPPPSEGFRVLH